MFKHAFLTFAVVFAVTVNATPFKVILRLDPNVKLNTNGVYHFGPQIVSYQVDTDNFYLPFTPQYQLGGKDHTRHCHIELKNNGKQIQLNQEFVVIVNPDPVPFNAKSEPQAAYYQHDSDLFTTVCDPPMPKQTAFGVWIGLAAPGMTVEYHGEGIHYWPQFEYTGGRGGAMVPYHGL